MLKVAIVVVAYNRTDNVSRLLVSLNNAFYTQEVTLIISIDKSDTTEVEELADNYVWKHGTKIVAKHSQNLGLRKHILSIGDYTRDYDAIVVLEDDLIVSTNFFNYTLATIEKYKDNEDIAGISLFLFSNNYQTNLPFRPLNNGYDVFLMNCAMSWGQIWMQKQWQCFIEWYKNNSDEFVEQPHLPVNVCKWPKSSWLKYHIRYCIENNKYFVYPYVSQDTNSGSVGTHSSLVNNIPQVPFMIGENKEWRLPDIPNAILYDGFMENKNLLEMLPDKDTCIDLNATKNNRENNRYWLTTTIAPYKVVKSYGMSMYPIEMNVINGVEGCGIYLYDTRFSSKKPKSNLYGVLDYHYKLHGVFNYLMKYGFWRTTCSAVSGVLPLIKRRIKKYGNALFDNEHNHIL